MNAFENPYRVRAEKGEVQLGTWVNMIRTPSVLTLLKAAGLDFARVDMDHSPFSIETVADMATLSRALNFPMVVRPPHGNREWITPLGERGMAGFGPHTEYRRLSPAEHMASANACVLVTIMLESKQAFDRLDEIAATPGIDAMTIGPTDLAQKHGKQVAMITDTVEGVREMIALGATLTNYSSDVGGLRAGFEAMVKEVRR
jgi:2-keto-3-deoxy-L-rhamnonate aldolase RhmA